jgi:hypothetical protein
VKAALAIALAAVPVSAGCGGPAASQHSDRAVVMISGRDDHGLVASQNVLLMSAPGGGSVVGPLPDGTLAEVRRVRGTEVEISAFGVTGWVDDFEVRGDVRLAGPPPTCEVRLAGRRYPAGTRVEVVNVSAGWATVHTLAGDSTTGQVPVSSLFELAPAPGARCPDRGSWRTG